MAYDNSGRAASARATRTRVLDAAKVLFMERGFAGTTVRAVAEQAGVSQETIYKSFGGKAGLLKAVYDVTLAGADDDLPLIQRPEAQAVLAAGSATEAINAYARLAQLIGSRTDPLVRMIMGSRDTDTALSEFVDTIHEERRKGSAHWVQQWHAAGWLRDDLSIERAADIVWALNSYEPRWLLADSGWTPDEITDWLGDSLRHALLH